LYPQAGRPRKGTPFGSEVPGCGRDRGAPPRGVDVKQPLGRPPGAWGTPGDPLDGGSGDPAGSRDSGISDPSLRQGAPPGGGPGRALRDPGPGSPVPGGRREGGFTSTPRAGAPRFPAGIPGTPWSQGPPGPPGRPETTPPRRGSKIPLFPALGNRGAPARGVDVKPPPGDPGIPEFGPRNEDFGHF